MPPGSADSSTMTPPGIVIRGYNPRNDGLHHDDCDRVAPFAADYMLASLGDYVGDVRVDNAAKALDVNTTVIMLMFANDPDGPRGPRDDNEEAWDRYMDVWSNYADHWAPPSFDPQSDMISQYYFEQSNRAFNHCKPEVCQRLGFAGDVEVLGPGAFASYWILALLSTLYFCTILAARRIRSYNDERSGHVPIYRILRSLETSIDTLLDSSLFFALTMLAAVIVRYVSIALERADADASFTPFLLGAYFSMFCSYPPLLILCLPNEDENFRIKSHTIKKLIWVFIVAVLLSVLFVAFTLPPKGGLYALEGVTTKKPEISRIDWADPDYLLVDNAWTVWCERSWSHMNVLLLCGMAFFGLYAVGSVVYSMKWLRKPQLVKHVAMKISDTWVSLLRVFTGIVALLLMWVTLVIGTIYRTGNSDRVGGGFDGWTLGQVLAFATWVPTGYSLFIQLWERRRRFGYQRTR